MDTSSSARYQLSNSRTLNGTLCAIAAANNAIPRSILGRFQSPVDSFSEPPGGSRMVIENRIVMIRHHPTANQRLYDEVYQTPRFRSSYPYRHCQARLAPSQGHSVLGEGVA